MLNHLAFPARGVTAARLAIFAALAAVAIFGMALPVMRLTRARAVSDAEAANPELEQRLTTFQEQRQQQADDPFLELLAADTLERTQYAEPTSLVPDNRLFALGGAGCACLAVLAMDDRRRTRLSGLWRVAAVDRAEEERGSAIFHRCDARERHGAAQQRSVDHGARDRHGSPTKRSSSRITRARPDGSR